MVLENPVTVGGAIEVRDPDASWMTNKVDDVLGLRI